MKAEISAKSIEIGFDKIGFAKAAIMSDAGRISGQSAEKGYFADLNYLERNIPIRENPKLLLKNAETIIAAAVNYYVPANYEDEKLRIANFAFGKDYHIVVKEMLRRLADFLKEEFGARSFISLDGGRVFEKLWAERCGIGFQGKNSLIITPEFGSFIFIGIIITDLKIDDLDKPAENLCGNCGKCIDACPAGAIVKEKILDIRRCISYKTIEAKSITPTYEETCGRLCGCDECQRVCPWNQNSKPTKIREFYPQNPENISVSAEFLRNATKEELLRIYGGTPVERALKSQKIL